MKDGTSGKGWRSASPARRRAVEVLREVLERGGRASPLLAERGAHLSGEDHDLLRHLVLGVLRHKDALDAELSRACRIPWKKLAPSLREILEVALYQVRNLERVPAYAAVDEAVRQARASGGDGAGRLVNAILRNILRAQPAGSAPSFDAAAADAGALARHFSHPDFLVGRWLHRFGRDRTLNLLASDNAPSGMDLMANPRRTDRPALAAALAGEGIVTETSPISPLGLSVLSGNPLRSPLFSAGHFAIQDLASQALPLLLPEGDELVDLAAAPGGKSFSALALGRARRVVSADRSPARLGRLVEASRRLGYPEAKPLAADVTRLPLEGGRFERVLFDAPCSGTGTLRKNPEIRRRLSPSSIDRLARAQREGLAAAAALLAPGGILLYATCSLEEEENERVVAAVLESAPGLVPAAIDAPPGLAPFVDGNRFRIFPGPTNDGFTAHLLRRGA
ncbi:MAG: transcription antitermination factor NusB [Acidobacteriota bacterium]